MPQLQLPFIDKIETCPCGVNGYCCDDQNLYIPKHKCTEDENCKKCFKIVCKSCKKFCYHEFQGK